MSVLICIWKKVCVSSTDLKRQIHFILTISPGNIDDYRTQRRNRHRSASLTAEAALVFPVFFFVVFLLWQLFLLLLFQLQVCNSVTNTVMTYSHLGYAARQAEQENVDISWIFQPLLWNSIPENKRAENLFVRCKEENGAVKTEVYYDFLCDAPCLPRLSLPVTQGFLFYPYLGETDTDRFEEEETKDVVYRTLNGTVYHESKACGYLTVTVRQVQATEVDGLRNSFGEKYTPCLRCDHMEQTGTVYISSGGDRYHRSASCVTLKRNVIEIKREEIGELPACHKCGKQEDNK